MITNELLTNDSYRWNFINSETSIVEFNNKLNEDAGGAFAIYTTPLGAAARKGNVPLIKHIFECSQKLGTESIFLRGKYSPLHLACKGEDDNKAYLAAKKLIELGSPTNPIAGPLFNCGSTPLDYALENKNFKTAGLLLRNGGIASDQFNVNSESLKKAKQNLMPETLNQFNMHFSNPKECGFFIPQDILNYISSISNKVELQD